MEYIMVYKRGTRNHIGMETNNDFKTLCGKKIKLDGTWTIINRVDSDCPKCRRYKKAIAI